MQYDYLDDVPHSVRMRLQDPMYQASSPTPSHYSIVTNNTPSPQPQHQQTHNQHELPLPPFDWLRTHTYVCTALATAGAVGYRRIQEHLSHQDGISFAGALEQPQLATGSG